MFPYTGAIRHISVARDRSLVFICNGLAYSLVKVLVDIPLVNETKARPRGFHGYARIRCIPSVSGVLVVITPRVVGHDVVKKLGMIDPAVLVFLQAVIALVLGIIVKDENFALVDFGVVLEDDVCGPILGLPNFVRACYLH